MLNEDIERFTVPQIINLTYEDFNLITETSSFKVFEARNRASQEKHAIRILDPTKEFVKQNPEHAATLFIQELLRLQYLYPGSVLVKTLEFSDQGKQIACATLPYAHLSLQLNEDSQVINSRDPNVIKKLLSDVLSDIQFLWNDFQVRSIMDVLGPDNICFMKKKDGFFLSNWAEVFENPFNLLTSTTLASGGLAKSRLDSQDIAAELKALAFAVLKVRKIDYSEVQALQTTPQLDIAAYDSKVKSMLTQGFHDSKDLQELLGRMLSLAPQNLPNLDEFKIKEVRTQINPIEGTEESKRTKSDSKTESPSKKKKIIIFEEKTLAAPHMLAWCSFSNNKISVIDLKTKQDYANFEGVKLKNKGSKILYIEQDSYSWTHVREIPNTKLLVSLHHSGLKSAGLEIFDISKKGQEKKIYFYEEVAGITGDGDATYNSRRKILGAIPVGGITAYHLFNIDTESVKDNVAKLSRSSKWHSLYSTAKDNVITGLDFSFDGEAIATIDRYGVCLISDVNTDICNFHLGIGNRSEDYNRCKWSTNFGEPLLFIKFNSSQLNILDVEKQALMLKDSIILNENNTFWIDVCYSDGNLISCAGADTKIKIYDRRESKIVKTFDSIHSDDITCVRWSPRGDMLATASSDTTVKLLDFKAEKVVHTGSTSDKKFAMSVCFI